MNVIKNECDRGFVIGCSTSLMIALANTAILVLFIYLFSGAKQSWSVMALRVLSGLLEWTSIPFGWISTARMYAEDSVLDP